MDGDGGEDLISRLPDCILGEIVTRLPTADGVRVQILSTRWRHAWTSSPLNLDLQLQGHHHWHYSSLMSDILAAHSGTARRLRLDSSACGRDANLYNRWLGSPALNGLRELEIDPNRDCCCCSCYQSFGGRDRRTSLPERALRFVPTLRVLRLGHLTFPSADAGAGAAVLRFPHLELLSFIHVDISEGTLHGVLAGCPVLRTLVIDDCTGFVRVRINSPTITSFAVSPVQSYWPEPEANLRQVIVEDAPLLEKVVPFRSGGITGGESFEIRVVSAPRLRVLGSLSSMTSKLVLGATVFTATSRRVNLVQREFVMVQEKRSLMHAAVIATTMRTVKVLALEDADCVDEVCNFLRCFPCLEKLYVTVSDGFRSVGSYDKLNSIECLEHHLKMVAINGYEDKRSHVKLAKFFARTARVLELMKIRPCGNYFRGFTMTKEWIADQQRQIQVSRNKASPNVKFHFVPGTNIWDLPVLVHDSSMEDPFDQWFES